MPNLNPKIIRYLERKKRQQLLNNVLFLSPLQGILVITFLEFVMSGLCIGLILSYEPKQDNRENSMMRDYTMMRDYSKFLNSFEIWFMFDRTVTILTTGIMVLGYRKSRRSLLLPYIFYVLVGSLGNLISMLQTTLNPTTAITLIISFEISSGLTVFGLWRRLCFRERVANEYSRFQTLSRIQEHLQEESCNDLQDSDVEDDEEWNLKYLSKFLSAIYFDIT